MQACAKLQQTVLRHAREVAVACVDKLLSMQALLSAVHDFQLEEDEAHSSKRADLTAQVQRLRESIDTMQAIQDEFAAGVSNAAHRGSLLRQCMR